MKFNKSQWIGIIFGVILIISSFVLYYVKYFDVTTLYFILGISFVIMGLPYFTNLLIEGQREKSIDQMFIEFSRDLSEGVRSGTPLNKSIVNLRNKDYGSLTPNIDKLANQVSMGIPVRDALDTFSRDLKNNVISRAVNLIKEADRSGGRIELILESVTSSVSQIDRLKKERKAAIYNLTVQGYIIFLIFIVIMLVMEFKILPITSQIGTLGSSMESLNVVGSGLGSSVTMDPAAISKSFLFLLVVQGFFAGLVIGKISEGYVKAGLKHSFVLVMLSWLLSTGVEKFFT